jgi:hypothetical protein
MVGRLAALVALSLYAATAMAADEPGDDIVGPVQPPAMDGEQMAYVGVATRPCSVFLAIMDAERAARGDHASGPDVVYTQGFAAFLSWTDGYLTARNETSASARMAGITSTHEQRARWLEMFCRANPDAPFHSAVFRLREQLIIDGH